MLYLCCFNVIVAGASSNLASSTIGTGLGMAAVGLTGGATGAVIRQRLQPFAEPPTTAETLVNCADHIIQKERVREALGRAQGDDFVAVFTEPRNKTEQAQARIQELTPPSGVIRWLPGKCVVTVCW